MTMLWQILVHTPLWVWGLLVLLTWLGWRGLQARATTPAQLAILPAVAGFISLLNALSSAAPAMALPAWLLAMAVAAPLGALIGQGRQLDVKPGPRRLWLAGSWFPMALGLSIFAIRYAMGVAIARTPSLAGETLWILGANALGGGVAGLGLGWLASLLTRYRRAVRAAGSRIGARGPITAT